MATLLRRPLHLATLEALLPPGRVTPRAPCFSRHSSSSVASPLLRQGSILPTTHFGRKLFHGSALVRAASVSGSGTGSGGNYGFFAWYLLALDKQPVLTKAITSAILNLIGDLICQIVIDRAEKVNLKRTLVFAFLGLVLVGPTLHIWYLYLSKLVTAQGAAGAIGRLLLDQFIFSPIFIGVFMSLLVTLEGNPSLVLPKLQQEWFPSVIANWQLWIPFQFLNFYFVPQKFQVLAANCVALAWNVILSFKSHKEVVLK